MNKNMQHTCPLCGGKMKEGKTTFTVELGEGIVVVRNVDAKVCGLCGYDWIDDKTAEKLENIVNDARNKHMTVEICEMS
jgi:YgiT-type zinc finger domain-containing protein